MTLRLIYTFFLVMCIIFARSQNNARKIKSKSTYRIEEDIKLLAEQKTFDQKDRLLTESKYGYWGKELNNIDRKYYYYGKNTDSILGFNCRKKDSVEVLRQIIHKQKGKKIKEEFFEKQSSKAIYSYVTYQYRLKGTDSTIFEKYKLYNGDSVEHTYKFVRKKITSHTVVKNGKSRELIYYYYDNDGRLIKKTTQDNVWGNSSTEEFVYEKSYKTKSTVETLYNSGRHSNTVYTYDEKGNELTVEYNNYNGRYKDQMASEFIQSEYIYENDMLKEVNSSSKGFSSKVFKTKTVYEYEFY